jgi:hypothetical protein
MKRSVHREGDAPIDMVIEEHLIERAAVVDRRCEVHPFADRDVEPQSEIGACSLLKTTL